jgi:hypothetical protein
LVYSIYDSTEAVIEEMVKECQRKIAEQYGDNNNSIVNEHLKLKIRTLQNAPRDLEKLEQLLKKKESESESERARHIQDIESLVTEIGTLKIIQYLVNRNQEE